jgi:ABC-2 type transport system permease protein
MTATTLDPTPTPPPAVAVDAHPPRSPARTWLRHVGVMTRRNLLHVRREPMQLSDVTIQPAIFVLLFTYVFGSAMVIAGGTYKQFAIPGMLTMILVTATPGTAVGISQDLSTGIIDRFRTLPTASSTILAGRSVSDILALVLATVITAVTGLLIGWRPDANVVSTIAGFGLVLLFAYAVSWGMLCLGLAVADPESAQATSFLLVFVPAFVSYAFVPIDGMPTVLQKIAEWNPISAVAAAARELTGSPNPSAAGHWPLEHAIPVALGWTALMLVVFVPLAVRMFRTRTTD